ncbi:MAG: LysR family transcriptional regulator [Pseudomonadales bacterium]|nr:LysR family transcriptional regulator [Pseudomonadales bacterium]
MMVFLAVVETGSFTQAAERLGIPKANVSRKVSRLEQQLGVTLLERSTRQQHLTEAGRRYLSHCKSIQSEVDQAEAAVSELLHSLSGPLRIGASVTIGQQIIKPALSQFMSDYGDIQLQLNLVNRRVDLIEEGFDVLIRVGQLEDSRLIAKRLGTAKRRIYVSPAYLKDHGEILDVDALCDCIFLLMGNIHSDGKFQLQSGSERRDLNIRPHLLVDDFSILYQTVLDGVGVAILPDYMCHDAIQSGALINILPEWGLPDVDIYALYPQHRANIPKVAAFLDFIANVFSRRLQP